MLDRDMDWKYLPVQRLRELLAELPDDARIGPNRVLNLMVFDPQGVPVAFVDFLDKGVIERFD